MLLSILATIALQATPADTPRVALDPATLAAAYLDPGARDLLAGARERRRAVDRSIEAYKTTVRERLSVELRAGWVERLLYRRETAAHIDWHREGPVRIRFLGAREVSGVARTEPTVPEDLDGQLMDEFMANLAFDPAEEAQLLTWGDSSFIRHPLAPGSERYYRFRSGDTTTVRLPDGRTVRVLELEVLPRTPSVNVIRGSFWLDGDSHAVVRAVFRLAEGINSGAWGLSVGTQMREDSAGAVDTVRTVGIVLDPGVGRKGAAGDAAPDRARERPRGPLPLRLVAALLPDIRARLQYVTIDYGLWEGHWWLPRLVAIEGVVQLMGKDVPLRYERRYDDYSVTGDPALGAGSIAAAERDPAEKMEFIFELPDDTASLLTSNYLPSSIFTSGSWLIDADERAALLGELARVGDVEDTPGAAWRFAWSDIDWDPLVRYNRIEALSVGLGAEADLGPVAVYADARLGAADLEPRGTVSILSDGIRARYELTGYRRLETMDPRGYAFSAAATASALLFGYDEPDYYEALGVSLGARPPASAGQWYEWRLYAQREDPVRTETDFSVPHLFDTGRRFRPNPAAAGAAQYGGELALRRWWGRDPAGLRWGGEARMAAATGVYAYVEPSLSIRTTFPLPGPVVGAFEAGAGAVWGDAALQHLRRVGGAGSIRGYYGSTLVGESSWRLRGELATRTPAARLIFFSDAGWAGPFDQFLAGDPLASAGLGVSFLDGFVRLDLARALVAPTGWRVMLYVDGLL